MEASKKLFTRRDGRGMCFYLPPSVRDKDGTRTKVKDLIESHGGRFRTPSLRVSQDDTVLQLVHVGDAGNEKALLAAEGRGEKLYYCTYVLDSVAKDELLSLEDYEVRLPPASVAQKRTHYRWTPEEDAALLAYASKSILARRGDTFWEEAERHKVTQHSWQAMKERYNKHLAPAQKAKAMPQQTPVAGNGVKESVPKPAPSNSPFPGPSAPQQPKQASTSIPEKPPARTAAQPITSGAPILKQTEQGLVGKISERTEQAARALAGSKAGSSRGEPVAGGRRSNSQPKAAVARAAKTAESRIEGRSTLSSLTEEAGAPPDKPNTDPATAQSPKPPSRREPVQEGRPQSARRPGQASQPATASKAISGSESQQSGKWGAQGAKPHESSVPLRNGPPPLPSQPGQRANQPEQLEDAQSVPCPRAVDDRERPKSPLDSHPPPKKTPSSQPLVSGSQELPPASVRKPVRGASVLRASPKTAPLANVSANQPIDIRGAAAAVHVQGKKAVEDESQPSGFVDERGRRQAPGYEPEGAAGRDYSAMHPDPFTQEPAAGFTETVPDEWSGFQEEPNASGKPAGLATSVGDRSGVPASVPDRQLIGEAAGLDEKKRARDDLTAVPAMDAGTEKRQRVGRQQLVPKERTAGSFSALLLESRGLEPSGEEGGAARGLRGKPGTAGVGIPADELERKADSREVGKQGRGTSRGEGEAHRVETNRAGVTGAGLTRELVKGVAKAGPVASNGGKEDGQGEERPEASGKSGQEAKRRRLQKVNGEQVGRQPQAGDGKPEQPAMEPTSADLAPERVSQIRSWVATFMNEYGCSQDDVIKALINAAGIFEAARPFLDARNRDKVREPGWGLREDHVLLTMPVEENHTHPAFVSLRRTFGNDAVKQRLRFLGRLGPK